jgi:SAM-dependent MidA family methyltransferase
MKFGPSPISFEQFMASALHDPEHGYYAKRVLGIGQRGDFTTAPMLSEAPARAIAAWAERAMRETGCRDLIEVGPGEGTLSLAVRKFLPWQTRWRTRCHLVETSAPLVKRQQELLGKRATWHRHLSEALAACGGRAVIFSNELVDAFPVRRFQNTDAGWREMAVHFDAAGVAHESLLPAAVLPISTAFLHTHPLGQIVEVHESYKHYLESWLPQWKAGRMLTIDYGAPAEALYQHRPRGTLRAYLLQQCLDGSAIYKNPGRQDLTADVNFTDLQNWSAPWVSQQRLLTLREFLEDAPGEVMLRDAGGAGDAFLALIQDAAGSQTS